METLKIATAETLQELQNFGNRAWDLAIQHPATAIGLIMSAGFGLLVYMMARDMVRYQLKHR